MVLINHLARGITSDSNLSLTSKLFEFLLTLYESGFNLCHIQIIKEGALVCLQNFYEITTLDRMLFHILNIEN